jgi:hypothetical protein
MSITPFFAMSYAELLDRLPYPSLVRISKESTLVVKGAGSVIFESLGECV